MKILTFCNPPEHKFHYIFINILQFCYSKQKINFLSHFEHLFMFMAFEYIEFAKNHIHILFLKEKKNKTFD